MMSGSKHCESLTSGVRIMRDFAWDMCLYCACNVPCNSVTTAFTSAKDARRKQVKMLQYSNACL